jgi:hypothetical protein
MVINGSGTITGLSAGGLPSATVTQATLATPVAGTGSAFSAYYNGTTSAFSSNTWTKCPLNATDFDTASNFNTSTYRFTPTVAGYYQISSGISTTLTGSTGGGMTGAIYKNGTVYKGISGWETAGAQLPFSINALIYFNGSTDYVELYVFCANLGGSIFGSSSASYGGTGSNQTYMTGVLVRAA